MVVCPVRVRIDGASEEEQEEEEEEEEEERRRRRRLDLGADYSRPADTPTTTSFFSVTSSHPLAQPRPVESTPARKRAYHFIRPRCFFLLSETPRRGGVCFATPTTTTTPVQPTSFAGRTSARSPERTHSTATFNPEMAPTTTRD
jgi:hypothetical protein